MLATITRFLSFVLSAFARRTRRDPSQTFEFWDGSRDRSIDPIEVWGRLNAGSDIETHLRIVLTPGPAGMDEPTAARFAAARQTSAEALAAKVCDVFGVAPYADGEGLTIPERVALAAAFVRHMARLGTLALPT